jgi:hypothetical protein
MKRRQLLRYVVLIISIVYLFPEPAMPYIGPGAGLSAIGAFIAIVVAVIAALFGFLWYPIKRFIRKRKKSSYNTQSGSAK